MYLRKLGTWSNAQQEKRRLNNLRDFQSPSLANRAPKHPAQQTRIRTARFRNRHSSLRHAASETTPKHSKHALSLRQFTFKRYQNPTRVYLVDAKQNAKLPVLTRISSRPASPLLPGQIAPATNPLASARPLTTSFPQFHQD